MSINPVLLKELKVRMRGWRAAAIILAYVGIQALVAFFVTYTTTRSPYMSTVDPSVSLGAYSGLAIMQFVLILFVAPALTAGAISGERERQTLDLLLCTKLSPFAIVTGKLFASISQIILLIFASLPIFSIVFLYGGISIVEIIQLFAFYLVIAVTVGSIGIFFSTYFKRTTAANVLTYGTIALLVFGTIFITMFYISIVTQNWNYQKIFPILYSNPMVGFSSVLMEQFGMSVDRFGFIPGYYAVNPQAVKGIEPWKINVAFNLILSLILLVLSAVKINPVKKGILHIFRRRRGKVKTTEV